jgi:hypothetical protein
MFCLSVSFLAAVLFGGLAMFGVQIIYYDVEVSPGFLDSFSHALMVVRSCRCSMCRASTSRCTLCAVQPHADTCGP